MQKRIFKSILQITIFLSVALLSKAQSIKEPVDLPESWSKGYEPFRIAGNLYYVGTYDLASYLITTSEGNILINTGLAASAPVIKSNIESLGFKLSDVKILLTTQAHYDHLGAMAEIKEMTGAKLWVDEKDAQAVEDGGSSDYAFGGKGSTFRPIKVDRLLKNGDTIQIGDAKMVMLHHPGHTKGSCSYVMTVKDERKAYKVLIANMPTIVVEKSFSEIADYPEIAEDYATTLNAMKKLSFDIWVASHASQFGLHSKRKVGDRYNPAVFIDQAGYDKAINDLIIEFSKKSEEK